MNNDDFRNIMSQHLDGDDWTQIERYFNGSEFSKHMGITVLLSNPENPKCEITDIKPFHLGGIGQDYINGAIISAMFDLVIGLTGLKYNTSGNFATSNLNIQLLAPVESCSFYATSKCNSTIGNRVFSEATLYNFKNEPCAYATGEIRIGLK